MSSVLSGKRVGFAMTGSFCTYRRVLKVLPQIAETGAVITPILSEISYGTDTRFMKASELIETLEKICGCSPLHTILEAEPIGPKGLLDLLVVAPATGNTMGKLANGITDSCVTMACKAQWRNRRPVVLAASTNDALTGSRRNMEALSGREYTYLLPMEMDDPVHKPDSMVAQMEELPGFLEQVMSHILETKMTSNGK